eukprot:Nk52_evm22s296 gene=Nk52_evmTU22s296
MGGLIMPRREELVEEAGMEVEEDASVVPGRVAAGDDQGGAIAREEGKKKRKKNKEKSKSKKRKVDDIEGDDEESKQCGRGEEAKEKGENETDYNQPSSLNVVPPPKKQKGATGLDEEQEDGKKAIDSRGHEALVEELRKYHPVEFDALYAAMGPGAPSKEARYGALSGLSDSYRLVEKIFMSATGGADGDITGCAQFTEITVKHTKIVKILDNLEKLIEKSPECKEIFSLWDEQKANRNNTQTGIILDAITVIVLFCRKPSIKQKGIELCRLIMRNNGRQMYSYMSSDKLNIVKKMLRLLNAIVGHSLTSAKEFMETFNFGFPAFQKLLHRRNKSDKEDVRTLYIKLMCKFIGYQDCFLTQKILETNGIFAPIFKGILGDAPDVVLRFLEHMRKDIVDLEKLNKNSKQCIFYPQSLQNLRKLYRYKWTKPGGDKEVDGEELSEEEKEVRAKVHLLLLRICTSPVVGIVDEGIFSSVVKNSNSKFSTGAAVGSKGNGTVLKFVSNLNEANEDDMAASLVVDIISACPSIRHKYLSSMPFSFDPRLSERWFKNTELYMRILENAPLHIAPSLPVSSKDFKIQSVTHLVECILPAPVSRQFLSQGIQNKEELVTARTLQMLRSIFNGFGSLIRVLEQVNKENGQFLPEKEMLKMKEGLSEALRVKLPDLQTIIALKNKFMPSIAGDRVRNDGAAERKGTGEFEMYSFILNTVEGYMMHIPQLFSESKFDFTKLVPLGDVKNEHLQLNNVKANEDSSTLHISDLTEACQLDALRLLQHISGVKWPSMGGSKLSVGGHIIYVAKTSHSLSVKDACKNLMKKMLCDTGFFGSAVGEKEIEIWLKYIDCCDLESIWVLDAMLLCAFNSPLKLSDVWISIGADNQEEELNGAGVNTATGNRVECSPLIAGLFGLIFAKKESHLNSKGRLFGTFCTEKNKYLVLSIWVELLHLCVEDTFVLSGVLKKFLNPFIEENQANLVCALMKWCLGYSRFLTGEAEEMKQLALENASEQFYVPEGACISSGLLKATAISEKVRNSSLETLCCSPRGFFNQPLLCGVFSDSLLGVYNRDKKPSIMPQGMFIASVSSGVWFTDKNLGKTVAACIKACSYREARDMWGILVLCIRRLCIKGRSAQEEHALLTTLECFDTLVEYAKSVSFLENSDLKSIAEDDLTAMCNSSVLIELCIRSFSHINMNESGVYEPVCKCFMKHFADTVNSFKLVASSLDRKKVTDLKCAVISILEQDVSKKAVERILEALPGLLVVCSEEELFAITQKLVAILLMASKNHNGINTLACAKMLLLFVNHLGSVRNNAFVQSAGIQCFLKQDVVSNLISLASGADFSNGTGIASILDQVILCVIKSNLIAFSVKGSSDWIPYLRKCVSDPCRERVEILTEVSQRYYNLSETIADLVCEQLDKSDISMNFVTGLDPSNGAALVFIPVILDFLRKMISKNPVSKKFGVTIRRVFAGCSFILLKHSKNESLSSIGTFSNGKGDIGVHLCVVRKVLDLILSLGLGHHVCTSDLERFAKFCCLKKTFYCSEQFRGILACIDFIQSCTSQSPEASGIVEKIMPEVYGSVFMMCLRTMLKHPIGGETSPTEEILLEEELSKYLSEENHFTKTESYLYLPSKMEAKFIKLVSLFVADCLGRRMDVALKVLCLKKRSARSDAFGGLIESLSAVLSNVVFKCEPRVREQILSGIETGFTIGRVCSKIVYHVHFTDLFCDETSTLQSPKEYNSLLNVKISLLQLISKCIFAEEDNTNLDREWVPALLSAYYASTSKTDRLLLSILHFLERAGVSVVKDSFVWGKKGDEIRKSRADIGKGRELDFPLASETIDVIQWSELAKSVKHFDNESSLEAFEDFPVVDISKCPEENSVYDPSFLLPLISHLVTECAANIDTKKIVESGILSFAITAMSSRDLRMRKAAYSIVSEAYIFVEGGQFREAGQICYLLTVFKNALEKDFERVPNIIASFVKEAIYVLQKPDHFLYSIVNRFLLQRPVIDLQDVPLFYQLFNSSSTNFRKERSWILRLIRDGMKDITDYRIYQRRHVFEMLLSFYDSKLADSYTRGLVIDVFERAVGMKHVLEDLVKNKGLLGWLNGALAKEHGSVEASAKPLTDAKGLDFNFFRLVSLFMNVVKGLDGVEQFIPFIVDEYAVVLKTILGRLMGRNSSGEFYYISASVMEGSCVSAFNVVKLSALIAKKYKECKQRGQILAKQFFPVESCLLLAQLTLCILNGCVKEVNENANIVACKELLQDLCDQFSLKTGGLVNDFVFDSDFTPRAAIECFIEWLMFTEISSFTMVDDSHGSSILLDIIVCVSNLLKSLKYRNSEDFKHIVFCADWIDDEIMKTDSVLGAIRRAHSADAIMQNKTFVWNLICLVRELDFLEVNVQKMAKFQEARSRLINSTMQVFLSNEFGIPKSANETCLEEAADRCMLRE